MSRQPSPTASGGAGQGPGAGPYDSGTGEYLTVSPRKRTITISVGSTDFFCHEIKRRSTLEGAMDVVLAKCNDDYYVILIRNTYHEPQDVYDYHKRWTWERAELAVRDLAEEECVCCDAKDYFACIDYEINHAVHTIMKFQAEADRLQRRQYARERKAYQEALEEGDVDYEDW